MEGMTTQTNGEVLAVYFTDANLVATARIQTIGEGLAEVMNHATHGKLLLNFRVVRAMSSSMLGKLIKLHKGCKAAKIDLKLCEICDDIMEVFTVTSLHKVFDIHPDEASALKAYRRSRWFVGR